MKNKSLILFLNIFLFVESVFATSDTLKSTHYKMNVGQGECSITISDLQRQDVHMRVAVIADMGSSSRQMHGKYFSLQQTGNFEKIFHIKAGVTPQSISSVSVHPSTERRKRLRKTVVEEISDRLSVREDSLSQDSELKEVNVIEDLKKTLEQVKILIVFLSHSDEDHINLFPDVLTALFTPHVTQGAAAAESKEPAVLLIAGGEWFPTKVSGSVKKTIEMIHQYKNNVTAIFPYEDARFRPDDIYGRELFTDPLRRKVKGADDELYDLQAFHGTLRTCLDQIYPSQRDEFFEKAGWTQTAVGPIAPSQYLLQTYILDNIYIWSLDCREESHNAQSLVWSHVAQDLNLVLVYTGDAEVKTFEKIKRIMGADHLTSAHPSGIRDPRYLVMMNAMHHGADTPENAPDSAFEIFKPDVCFFPAGSGRKYGHPSKAAADQYVQRMSELDVDKRKSKRFWERYDLLDRNYTFLLFERDKGAPKGFTIRAPGQTPTGESVLLGTNAYGTMRIDQEGISFPHGTMPGYSLYGLQHAYEYTSNLVALCASFRPNPNEEKEAYEDEVFWGHLKDKVIQQSSTRNVYDVLDKSGQVYDKYKMYGIRKGRQTHFYVMEKIERDEVQDVQLAAAAIQSGGAPIGGDGVEADSGLTSSSGDSAACAAETAKIRKRS